MDGEIISACIQAGGAMAAAVIAGFFARGIIKDDIKPLFLSYSELPRNLDKLLEKAEYNIVVATTAGDHLLQKYGCTLKAKLKSGVQICYLFLDQKGFRTMERYMHGTNANKEEAFYQVVKYLKEWNDELADDEKERLQIRVLDGFMTASYICVDIPLDTDVSFVSPESAIQVMQYQYLTKAKDSPLSRYSLKDHKKAYNTTVCSIRRMWNAAKNCVPENSIKY